LVWVRLTVPVSVRVALAAIALVVSPDEVPVVASDPVADIDGAEGRVSVPAVVSAAVAVMAVTPEAASVPVAAREAVEVMPRARESVSVPAVVIEPAATMAVAEVTAPAAADVAREPTAVIAAVPDWVSAPASARVPVAAIAVMGDWVSTPAVASDAVAAMALAADWVPDVAVVGTLNAIIRSAAGELVAVPPPFPPAAVTPNAHSPCTPVVAILVCASCSFVPSGRVTVGDVVPESSRDATRLRVAPVLPVTVGIMTDEAVTNVDTGVPTVKP
jgi:hypothetical protein